MMGAAEIAAAFIWWSGLLIGAGFTIAIAGIAAAIYIKVIEDV